MMTFEKAAAIIESHPDDCTFAGPIQSIMVAKAEKILGLKFPPSYKEFLLRYGAGDCWAEEFYGINKNPETDGKAIPNAIWATLHSRKIGNLPDSMIKVMSSGFGPVYVIDTSQKNDIGECPVLLYYTNGLTEPVASSFGDFFCSIILEAKENN